MTRGARRSLVCALLTAASVVPTSCGVPGSGDFEPITRDDVQFDLDATSTTSTSTTTTTPPTTIDATTSTTVDPTTSTIATEEVLLYFVAGNQLNPVPVRLTRSPAPQQVLAKLLEGPELLDQDIAIGLRTTIPEEAEITVDRASGVGIIDVPAGVFDVMPSRDQRLFFAQLVLTIGRLGGIGPVQFTRDGEPIGAIRGDGTTTEPGDAVTIDDYLVLLGGSETDVPAPTSSATTSTSTTMPGGTGTTGG